VNQSNVSENYFAFFGLSASYNLDLIALENNYRKIQSESHPDRFVTASSSEKLASMQTATLANEAYLTLKNPANRAKYLLTLRGYNATDETRMPADFLMRQMEWREAIDDAKTEKDILALEKLLQEIQVEAKQLQSNLTELLDTKKDYATALDDTRKLIFIDKVCADINKVLAQIEEFN
jgi:molecular chaperone HscB